MVNRKQAIKLAKEVLENENIIQNSQSSIEEKKKAEGKISLITQAYANNVPMLVAIAGEVERLMKN